jgi:hypothetical protein
MKLQVVHSALEIQMPQGRREAFIDAEDPKNTAQGVTLDLVHFDECKTTCVVVNYKGLKRPKCIPLANIRTFVPYAPEPKTEVPKKGK